eukprot:TRINITY_DN7252_c0_g1_i1.p1 TRINITY_DN7252_c0_g1~~TRINITY_DN7252_c0_g1_i1.p1  ORF type:complete len:189 (+),score=41.76 TRINITY_DN7252_c0_g1_i1:105-671(+)
MFQRRRNPRDGITLDEADINPSKAVASIVDRIGPFVFAGVGLGLIFLVYLMATKYMASVVLTVHNESDETLYACIMCGTKPSAQDIHLDAIYERQRYPQRLDPRSYETFKLSNKLNLDRTDCYVVYGTRKFQPKSQTFSQLRDMARKSFDDVKKMGHSKLAMHAHLVMQNMRHVWVPSGKQAAVAVEN